MAVLCARLMGPAPTRRIDVMKRFLMAAVLAVSALSFAGAAMAASDSDNSFIKQQNQQYNQDNGE